LAALVALVNLGVPIDDWNKLEKVNGLLQMEEEDIIAGAHVFCEIARKECQKDLI
jgi:hypothetical protein